jgi:hypothetical protein
MVGSAVVDVPFAWTATPLMLADVQTWLNNPLSNHGWLLQGSESPAQTGRIFYSREATNPEFAPQLTVTFTPVPEPSAVFLAAIAIVGLAMLQPRRTHP